MSHEPSITWPPGPPHKRSLSLAHARNLYRYIQDPLACVGARFDTYGDVYLVHTGGERTFVLQHPEHFADVLVREANAFIKRDFGLEKFLGRGLLTSEGDQWKQRRRMIQPSFSNASIARYATIMVEESDRVAAGWRADQRLDMSEAMRALTLSIVARTLFSHRITHEDDDIAASMAIFQESVGTFDPLPEWLPSPKHRRIKRAIAEMDQLMFRIIEARRAARARGEASPGDLLDGLLDAVDPDSADTCLDRHALRDELLTLYLAGHETTANAVSWAWLLLSRNLAIDTRLCAELHAVLGERPATREDLEALPYLRAVCCEVLRLYPPAYVLARRAIRDVQIGEWTVPAGSPISLWIYRAHHDPRWFPDPERFDPDRFMVPHTRPKFAFMPFGGGARMCIGKNFALLEMQLMLASLVRNFRFELDPIAVKTRPRVTLTPAGGLPGVLRRRAAPDSKIDQA